MHVCTALANNKMYSYCNTWITDYHPNLLKLNFESAKVNPHVITCFFHDHFNSVVLTAKIVTKANIQIQKSTI